MNANGRYKPSCWKCNDESQKHHLCPQSAYSVREEINLAVIAKCDKCYEGKLEVAMDHKAGECILSHGRIWKASLKGDI